MTRSIITLIALILAMIGIVAALTSRKECKYIINPCNLETKVCYPSCAWQNEP